MDRLSEIKERSDKAMPGPWHATHCEWECDCTRDQMLQCENKEPDTCGNGRIIAGAMVPETKTVEWGDYEDMNDADAEFIANARTDIPYLLSLLEKAMEDIKHPSVCDRCTRHCEGDNECIDNGYMYFKWRGLSE